MTNSPKTVHFLPELEAATGKFDFPMTNDYMFRAVLQSNNKALTGQDYGDIPPVIHIGILDFTLFKGEPEFYATNKLMNTRTHKIYSDKFTLHVLELRHTELATEEDKVWGIDHWAKLFKTTIWEKLRMIAQDSEYMAEAANSIFRINADDMARKRCRDREEHYREIRGLRKRIEEMDAQIEEMGASLEAKDAEIARLRKQIENNNT